MTGAKGTPAGFWRRLAAFGLDYLLIAVYIAFLTLLSRLISDPRSAGVAAWIFNDPVRADLFAFASLVLPVSLYFALSEQSAHQATWGKRCMRLRVTGLDGGRISLARSLVRTGMKFLPWQISHTSLFHIPGWPFDVQDIPPGPLIGFSIVALLVLSYLALLGFDRRHRPPYDRFAGTMVEKQSA